MGEKGEQKIDTASEVQGISPKFLNENRLEKKRGGGGEKQIRPKGWKLFNPRSRELKKTA